MNLTNFNNSFNEFIDNDNEQVLIVKGFWGVGKTYSIRNALKTVEEKNKNATHLGLKINKPYIEVSLFGVNNIEKLSNIVSDKILQNWIPLYKSDALHSVLSVPFISKFLPQKNINLDKNNSKLQPIRIFFFDDIERMSLSMKEFFGYIDSIKSNSKIKVIIAINDNQIQDKETWELKEKITNREIRISNTHQEVTKEIFKDDNDAELFIKIFNQLNIFNLRVIIKSHEVMKKFIDKSRELNPQSLFELKVSCLCLSSEYYSSEKFDSKNIQGIHYYNSNNPFNTLIKQYLDSQIFDDYSFKKINEDILKNQIKDDNKQDFFKIISIFEQSFEDKTDEIATGLRKILENIDYLESNTIIKATYLLHGLKQQLPEDLLLKHIEKNESLYIAKEILNYVTSEEIKNSIIKHIEEMSKNNDEETLSPYKNDTIKNMIELSKKISSSRLNLFHDEMEAFKANEWLEFFKYKESMEFLNYNKKEIVEFITSKQGTNLKEAIITLAKTPINKLRLKDIFNNFHEISFSEDQLIIKEPD